MAYQFVTVPEFRQFLKGLRPNRKLGGDINPLESALSQKYHNTAYVDVDNWALQIKGETAHSEHTPPWAANLLRHLDGDIVHPADVLKALSKSLKPATKTVKPKTVQPKARHYGASY